MPPILNPPNNGKPGDPPKSWKKINEERKALKKQRKQEKQIKLLEKQKELDTLEVSSQEAETKKEKRENPSTISIAVPGSILENAQSAELRTYVAGQIARAACIFRVNEVIVFDDIGLATAKETKRVLDDDDEDNGNGITKTVRGSSLQLARILQYLECPQYLRKFFFPLHKDLKYSGLLNPLDTPHHLRVQNSFIYREGIISDKKAKEGFSYVNVGLYNDVLVNKAIEPGVRVTVKLNTSKEAQKKLRGTIVSPEEPRRETGVYWGYQVRIAHSISEIFTKSPYENGYDLTIGTSDRGTNVHDVEQKSLGFDHMLIVFGGLKGLEGALAADEQLNVDDPALLFDQYINVLPRQGSRTIRTEEALLIALAALQEKIQPKIPDIEEDLSQFLPRSEDTGGGLVPQQAFTKKKKKNQPLIQEETEAFEPNESFKNKPSDEIALDETPPAKLRKTDNPFADKKENKINPNKSEKSPFQNKKEFSVKQKKSENTISPRKSKNPFKPKEEATITSPGKEDVGNDFEVVPIVSVSPDKAHKSSKTDDLSRFD